MKYKIKLFLFAVAVLPASATVQLDTQFGTAFDSSGVAVANGTLWALVVDTNNDGIFTGFNNNQSLANATPGTADTYFTSGMSLTLGTLINGNTVFALGSFNGAGPGITANSLVVNYSLYGTASGRTYAVYWFPGASYTGLGTETIGSQVGGLNTTSNDGIFDIGMTLPSDGALATTGAATANGGGTIADTTFRAVTLVPEPSAILLTAFGALGLLRRRRN